jgi:RimJ/RimL family protein N-acetyltransferase
MGAIVTIETSRLTLVRFAPAHLLALVEGDARFAEQFGRRAAAGLREMFVSGEIPAQWFEALRAARSADLWVHGLAIVQRAEGLVIGTVGFKGPPDEAGQVEIAYGLAPEFAGRGYATEAVAATVAYALEREPVRRIIAHTLPTGYASMRVLAKCGFEHTGETVDPDDGLVWRWEHRVMASTEPSTFRA